MAGPTDIWHERSKLLSLCQEYFVLVVDVLAEKRDKLSASAIFPKGNSNCPQSTD